MSTVSTEKMMAQIACKAIDDKKGQDIISIVYKGDSRSSMYTLMNEILSTFAKQ